MIMEEKINVAELLKDCPKGMELDCTMFDNVTFVGVNNDRQFPIETTIGGRHSKYLTKEGCFHDTTLLPEAKCVIFPKGKTTWEGFHRPFKDGDILFYKHKSNNVKYICIYKRRIDMHYLLQYCGWFLEKPYLSEQFNTKERIPLYENDDIRLATEEEKEKLFQAIKDNGYKWNAETKTLEKLIEPKFKVGDKIKNKNSGICDKVIKIFEGCYLVESCLDEQSTIGFDIQYNWELVTSKFDINTLKPFDKVLVRDENLLEDSDITDATWSAAIYSHNKFIDNACPYVTTNGHFAQCVPYKGNEHLLGTTDDCDDYYKTWK